MLSSPKPKLQGGGGCGGWNKAWCFAFWKQIDSLKFNLKETNKWMEVSLKEFTTDGQQAYEKMLMSLIIQFSSVQFSSVAQSYPTLCDPMNCSRPGLPLHHQLPGFTQTHVHRVSDAIQPSHPLSSPSPPAPNPSQHQNLFQWVNTLHEVAKVLEFQL